MAMAGPQGGAAGGSGPGAFGMLIPILLMFGIIYLLMIRPQQKKMKAHQRMLGELKKGDDVVTSGGVYGRVSNIADKVVTLEVADKVKIRIAKGHISGKKGDEVAPRPQA